MPSSLSARLGRRLGTLVAGLACVAGLPLLAQSSAEDTARKLLDVAKDYLKQKNYTAGLRDLDEILKIYSTTSVADDALLEQSKYYLDVARNPAEAKSRIDMLRRNYRESDSMAMSYVVEGGCALLAGRSPNNIASAIEAFDKVGQLYKGNKAIPESMYRAASAARVGGNASEAVRRFADLATRYPTSEWTALALLDSSLALIRAGQPATRAMEQLQRVRNKFPQSRTATTALEWNTLLYRLYLKAQTRPIYELDEKANTGAPAKLRDVRDLAVSDRNDLLVATKNGVTVYPMEGPPSPLVASNEPRSVFFNREGHFLTVHELGISDNRGRVVPLEMPPEGDHSLRLKVVDAAMMALGEYLLADADRRTVYRFSAAGKFTDEFVSQVRIRRLAIDDLDQVALLGDKAGVLYGRDAKQVGSIAERGPTYRLEDPSDICVDPFGHIYVLDRSTILVFSPDGAKLLTSFTLPKDVQAQSIAVNSSGRLYVFDSRTDAIQVYR
jgi:outer membrane protein assembly factor BamD (BamD/ComL family)